MSRLNLDIFRLTGEIEGIASPIPSHQVTLLLEERQSYLPSPKMGVGVGNWTEEDRLGPVSITPWRRS